MLSAGRDLVKKEARPCLEEWLSGFSLCEFCHIHCKFPITNDFIRNYNSTERTKPWRKKQKLQPKGIFFFSITVPSVQLSRPCFSYFCFLMFRWNAGQRKKKPKSQHMFRFKEGGGVGDKRGTKGKGWKRKKTKTIKKIETKRKFKKLLQNVWPDMHLAERGWQAGLTQNYCRLKWWRKRRETGRESHMTLIIFSSFLFSLTSWGLGLPKPSVGSAPRGVPQEIGSGHCSRADKDPTIETGSGGNYYCQGTASEDNRSGEGKVGAIELD